MLVVHVYVLTHAVLYRSLSLCLFISSVCSCLWVHASEVEREEEEWGAVFALRGAHVVLPDQKEDMQWGRLHVASCACVVHVVVVLCVSARRRRWDRLCWPVHVCLCSA